MSQYLPVPVDEARQISAKYGKAIVVIIAIDMPHHQVHSTTFGRQPEEKIAAAKLGDALSRMAGGDIERAKKFEDFRDLNPAQWAAEKDQYLKACRAADHAVSSLLATRVGITDDVLIAVQAELRKAMEMVS